MTSDLTQSLNKGDLVAFSTGEYSDYSICPPMVMAVTRTKQELVDEFMAAWPAYYQEILKEWPHREYTPKPRGDDFISWLSKVGYVIDITQPYTEWHVGSYGDFEP